MTAANADRNRRRSIRLKGYDYARAGAYFVTVCTWRRECLFGDVADGEMSLNDAGKFVATTWDDLPARFAAVQLDAFVVMPNHIHGILLLMSPIDTHDLCTEEPAKQGGPRKSPLTAKPPARTAHFSRSLPRALSSAAIASPTPQPKVSGPTLGEILRAFKSISAVGVNRRLHRQGLALWQRGYYEHIIRDPQSLDQIRRYIEANPFAWPTDRENPAVTDRGHLEPGGA